MLLALKVQMMTKERDRLKALLRGAGLRATGPRVAVYAAVEKGGKPISHSQLVKQMRGHDLDSATIYRNLIKLSEAGLLKVVSRANGMARYANAELGHDHDHEHAHFVCSDCNTVSCLPEEALPKPKVEGRWSASLESAQMVVRGTCPDCLP